MKDERGSLAELGGGEEGGPREQPRYVLRRAGAEATVVGALSGALERNLVGDLSKLQQNIPEGFHQMLGTPLSSLHARCLTDPAGARGRGMMLGRAVAVRTAKARSPALSALCR